jgi:hypothetical protein
MYSRNSSNLPTPTEAAARLIGFYTAINAISPETYAAGMVALFSHYPARLVAEAVDPLHGLPSLHDYTPTIKQAKEFLEPRYAQELKLAESERRRRQQLLPAPVRDPQEKHRINQGFQQLGEALRAMNLGR